jgi:hypothetical protein
MKTMGGHGNQLGGHENQPSGHANHWWSGKLIEWS